MDAFFCANGKLVINFLKRSHLLVQHAKGEFGEQRALLTGSLMSTVDPAENLGTGIHSGNECPALWQHRGCQIQAASIMRKAAGLHTREEILVPVSFALGESSQGFACSRPDHPWALS